MIRRIAVFLVFILGLQVQAQDKYVVDNQASKLNWHGRKVTGEHKGGIQIKSGTFLVEGNELTAGTFEIDMTTITDFDLEDQAWNQKLVGHLKSDDFFGVEKHPVARFVITEVGEAQSEEGMNKWVKGDLTIKGITNSIGFPALVEVRDGQLKAKATITVNRAKFDVRYGSGSFFENLGDKLIYDDFDLQVDLLAKK